jgi:hypothetical protein
MQCRFRNAQCDHHALIDIGLNRLCAKPGVQIKNRLPSMIATTCAARRRNCLRKSFMTFPLKSIEGEAPLRFQPINFDWECSPAGGTNAAAESIGVRHGP